MSEAKHFIHTFRVAPRSDVAVLLTCFGLTVFTDMVVGVGVGIGLAAMLFMRRMVAVTEAGVVGEEHASLPGPVPSGVIVYRVSGPLFFGAAQKAMGALGAIADRCRVVVFWLDQVPAMDVTGLVALESAVGVLSAANVAAILHGLRPQPRALVERAGLLDRPGVFASDDAVETLRLAGELAAQKSGGLGSISARLQVSEVMSRDVAVVAPSASLREVVETMLGKGRRAVPVVDGGRVVGIITNGDLVQRGGLGIRLELLRGLAWSDVHAHLEGLAGAAKTAADVMTARPVTIQASAPLRRVAGLMAQRRLKRLPVADQGGALVGMVSRIDVLRASAGMAQLPEERAAALGVPGATQVARIMRVDVPSVSPEAPLAEVLKAVISTRLNKALVVDGDRHVIGLVTDAELMDRMAASLRPGLLRSLMQRLPFSLSGPGAAKAEQHTLARSASDLMITGVPLVHQEASLAHAISAMLEADRKILAVVDSADRLVGIVDRADLLRGIAESGGGEAGPADPAPASAS